MKGFWKYFTLTILLVLGLGCIGVLYLFFVPGSSLFNITYISKKENFKASIDATDVTKIEMYSKNFDINFTTNDEEQIIVEVYSNPFVYNLTLSVHFGLNQFSDSSQASRPWKG